MKRRKIIQGRVEYSSAGLPSPPSFLPRGRTWACGRGEDLPCLFYILIIPVVEPPGGEWLAVGVWPTLCSLRVIRAGLPRRILCWLLFLAFSSHRLPAVSLLPSRQIYCAACSVRAYLALWYLSIIIIILMLSSLIRFLVLLPNSPTEITFAEYLLSTPFIALTSLKHPTGLLWVSCP